MMEFLAANFNLPTIIVGAIVFGGVGWITWHSHKHGGCSGCSGGCDGGCSGNCSSCGGGCHCAMASQTGARVTALARAPFVNQEFV